MDKKLQKSNLTDINFLIAQYLQSGHYQILLIILLKEFLKLNVKTEMTIKDTQLLAQDTKTVGGVLNPQELKINRIEMFMLQQELPKKCLMKT